VIEPQPVPPAVPGEPLIMPADEFAALRKVAEQLGMLPSSAASPEPDTAAMGAGEGGWRERAEAAERRLATLAAHNRQHLDLPGSCCPHLARENLAIIGTGEEVSGDDWSFTDPAL